MTPAARLREAVDSASNHAVKLILPKDGLRKDAGLDLRAIARVWRGPNLGPLSMLTDRIGLPLAGDVASRVEQASPPTAAKFFQDAASAGAAPYAVIGDSHSRPMVRRARQGGRWLLPLHWLCHAASARGLANDEGRSGASGVARRGLAALEPYDIPVIFKFGQVDVEFVYAFKRIASGVTAFNEDHYAAFVDETVDRYAEGLEALTPKTMRSRLVLASIFPPALSDQAWAEGYANAAVTDLHADQSAAVSKDIRTLEIPSLPIRTTMHARFNGRLRTRAAEMGAAYLDCFTPFLGADGLLDHKYRGDRQGRDHHLGFQAARGPIIAGLWSGLGGL